MRGSLSYVATNLLNGKKYIGVTSRKLGARQEAHFYHASKGSKTKFHRAIRKHGKENFKFELLQTYPSLAEALKDEVRLIAEIRPEYNITKGGEGVLGNRHGKKTRQVFREVALTPEGQERWSNYVKLGSKSVSMPVICENTGEVFESQAAAARAYGLGSYAVSSVCNGHLCKAAKGLKFRRLTESECISGGLKFKARWKIKRRTKAFYSAMNKRYKSIICVDDDQYFASVEEAFCYYGKKATSSRLSNAHIAIKNGWRIAGHLFAYAEELRQ